MSYVVVPIALVVTGLGVAMTSFGVGSGRGWASHRILLGGLKFYLACALCGMMVGAAIGLIAALLPPARPDSRRATWWAAASRPRRIRLGSRSEDTSRRPCRRLWPWLVGVPVFLVVATPLAAGLYLKHAVDRRLADAIAAADRDDPSWRINDLMAARAPVPDEENSALVVGEVVSLLPESWPSAPAPLPGQPRPSPTAAAEAYDSMGKVEDNVRLDDPTADALRVELELNQDAVDIARTVADYDRGRHELELGPSLIDTLLPETQEARTVARLLAADAAIRAQDGDLDGALDSCRAILGVGRSIGDEPFIISQLVRVAIGGVACKSARRALAQGEPSDEALARLQALVLDERDQPLLLHGLKGERATLTELIRRVGAGEVPISALSSGDPPFDPDAPRAAIAPWGKLMFDNHRAVGLDWMNELVAIARRPPAAQPPLLKAWHAEVDRVKRSRFGLIAATLPLLLMPAMDSAASAHSRYQAELGAMAILLAAERHRRRTGDWPASIAAIDPAILPSPPLDPFSGRPFLLERGDGRWLNHSIGPNLKDERGAYEPKRWTKGGPDDIGAGAWDVHLRGQPAQP